MKTMKRIVCILLAAMMLFALTGCGTASVKKCISNYFDNIKKGNFEAAGKSLDDPGDDYKGTNFEEALKADAGEEGDESIGQMAKAMEKVFGTLEYSIKEVKISGDTATASVNFKMVDSDAMYEAIMGLYLDDLSDDEFEKKLDEIIKDTEKKEETIEIELKKDGKNWVIDTEKSNKAIDLF